jgi:hypothetical protein
LFPAPEHDDLSSPAYRQLIGYFGLVLPPLLWLISGWRPTAPLEPWALLSSLSAYYYTGAVAVQIGILTALAFFLFTYRGYRNEYRRRDRLAAAVAATAAVLVALFPAAAPHSSLTLSWWTPWIGRIHYAAGVVQFIGFAVFALVLFPRSKDGRGKSLPTDKRLRNRVYLFCGWGIVACLLWAGRATLTHASIFWPETLAVELFAISWLAKGRAVATMVAAATLTLHYVQRPRQGRQRQGTIRG